MQTEKPARVLSVIFVSNAKNEALKEMTQTAINTCLKGGVDMQIIVVEQQPDISYNGADTTHFPQTNFNYNKALNHGASFCVGDYIAFCNNDLYFSTNWALNLLNKMDYHKCTSGSPAIKIGASAISWKVRVSFAGWCFVWSKEMYEDVGLSEKYSYWCSDNIAAKEANEAGYFHVKAGNSVVKHLNNQTGSTVDKEELKKMTWQQAKDFKDNERIDIFPPKLIEYNLR